jgi:hypothetical protein
MANSQTNVVTVDPTELIIEPSAQSLAERDFCEAVTKAVSKCEVGAKALDATGTDVRNFYGSVEAFEADRKTVKAAVIKGLSREYRDAIAVAAVLPDLRTAAGKKLSDADKDAIKKKKEAARNADAYAEVYVSKIRDAAWEPKNDAAGTDEDGEGEATPKASDSDKARAKMAAFIEWLQKRSDFDFDVGNTVAALLVAQRKMQPSID